MTIPPELLRAICDPNGGKVVLVTGAGVSKEPPTDIPLASACSQSAHDQLVFDGVIKAGDCADPRDLSALADVVRSVTGKQRELAIRLPHEAMRNAAPNEGHLIAIALMVEGAISNIITLNYDLAFSHAISELRVKNGISDIRGPENHGHLGQKNLIYLHRSAESDMETWVLTTYALEQQWQDGWEEVMVRFATATPLIVFAGLGSSCGVLRHSSRKLKDALGNQSRAFLITRSDPSGSKFVTEIEIDRADCITSGWVAFMRALASRYMDNVALGLADAADELSRRERWLDGKGTPTEDISRLVNLIKSMGLLAFSVVRARWQLRHDAYCRTDGREVCSLADTLVAIRLIESIGNATATILECGRVRFSLPLGKVVHVAVVCGNGNLRWGSVEATLMAHENYLRRPKPTEPARRVLVVQVIGTKPASMALPTSILDGRENDDLVIAGENPQFWGVEEIRDNPALVGDLLQ